jgi:hypothetical protein
MVQVRLSQISVCNTTLKVINMKTLCKVVMQHRTNLTLLIEMNTEGITKFIVPE